MTIPTPGEFAKRAQERKQQELDSAAKAKANHPAGKQLQGSPKGSSKGLPPRATSKKSQKASSNVDSKVAPGVKPPVDKQQTSSPSSTANSVEKKPFVLKPHLTQRLSQNEELQKLRDSLPMNKKQGSRKPRRHTGNSSKRS